MYDKFEVWLKKVHSNLSSLGKQCMKDTLNRSSHLKKQAEDDAAFEKGNYFLIITSTVRE